MIVLDGDTIESATPGRESRIIVDQPADPGASS